MFYTGYTQTRNRIQSSFPNSRTAKFVVVENIAVSVCEERRNAIRFRRFEGGDVVVVIDARGTGIDAIEPAVGFVAAREGLGADAGALATIAIVKT